MNNTTIIDLVQGVTKKWTKQRDAEHRDARRQARRASAWRPSYRVTIKSAAYNEMERAYLKASDNGTLPAHARQVMYAARGAIQQMTGELLDDHYFTQTLLPDYMQEYAHMTANWDVVFDARGHFVEPHTDRNVPLGTLDVRRYLADVGRGTSNDELDPEPVSGTFNTCGPLNRYGAILFIEKEGFMPLLAKVGLAERYDIAIMSTKGLSNTASRRLIDKLHESAPVPLLVLHDFDKSGFSIVGTLRRATRRYQFRNSVDVIDLGIRLPDVMEQKLQSEASPKSKSDPTPNLRKNGATADDIAFLRAGQRVELNAFPSRQLVNWIEQKLQQHGVKKVVPDAGTLTTAYRRAAAAQYVNTRMDELSREAVEHADGLGIPDDLGARVANLLKAEPSLPWDQAVARIVGDEEDE